jgi:hypothetical protein
VLSDTRAGDAREHLAGPRPARLALAGQVFLDKFSERDVSFGGFLRQRGVLCGDSTEAKLIAQLDHALMLDIHKAFAKAIDRRC